MSYVFNKPKLNVYPALLCSSQVLIPYAYKYAIVDLEIQNILIGNIMKGKHYRIIEAILSTLFLYNLFKLERTKCPT